MESMALPNLLWDCFRSEAERILAGGVDDGYPLEPDMYRHLDMLAFGRL